MESNEKKSVFKLFMDAPFVYMMAALARMLLNNLASNQSGIVFTMVNAIINSFVSCASASFYLNAVKRGVPDLRDTYRFLMDKTVFTKFLSIMLVYMIVEIAGGIILAVAAFIPFINIVVAVGTILVMIWFVPVWYLFAANPNCETGVYFKMAKDRMKGNVIEYLAIMVVYVLCMVFGAMILGVVLPVFGILGIALIIPAAWASVALVGLVIAEFMEKIIPPQWYYQQDNFTRTE